MKIYQGHKYSCNSNVVWVVYPGQTKAGYVLPHIERHSPDGFNWGYGGSGPADLALSILTDFAGVQIAEKLYQKFKFDFIATAGSKLMIPNSLIIEWLEKQGIVSADIVNK